VGDQVEKLRGRFGLERVVLVGDCGTLIPPQIANFISIPAGWITGFVEERRDSHSGGKGALQLSLLDKQNLAEIASPDYPARGSSFAIIRFWKRSARASGSVAGSHEKEFDEIAKEVGSGSRSCTLRRRLD